MIHSDHAFVSCWRRGVANHHISLAIPSQIFNMYGIFTYIYHKHQPNVGKYGPYILSVWSWREESPDFFAGKKTHPQGVHLFEGASTYLSGSSWGRILMRKL